MSVIVWNRTLICRELLPAAASSAVLAHLCHNTGGAGLLRCALRSLSLSALGMLGSALTSSKPRPPHRDFVNLSLHTNSALLFLSAQDTWHYTAYACVSCVSHPIPFSEWRQEFCLPHALFIPRAYSQAWQVVDSQYKSIYIFVHWMNHLSLQGTLLAFGWWRLKSHKHGKP